MEPGDLSNRVRSMSLIYRKISEPQRETEPETIRDLRLEPQCDEAPLDQTYPLPSESSSTPMLDAAGASLEGSTPRWQGLEAEPHAWSRDVHALHDLSTAKAEASVQNTGFQTAGQTGHTTSRLDVEASRDGFTAMAGQVRRTASQDDDHGTFRGGVLQVDQDGTRLGAGISEAGKGYGAEGSFVVGTDGIGLNGGVSHDFGRSTQFEGSGIASLGEDGLTLGYGGSLSHSWEPVALGDPNTSAAGYGRPGAATQATVNGSMSDSFTGDLTAERPVRNADGSWLVTYSYSAEASRELGVGLGWTGLQTGGELDLGGLTGVAPTGPSASAGLGGKATLGAAVGGRQSFPTEEEALAFYHAPVPSPELVPPAQADSALSLKPGEERTIQVTLSASASLSAGGTGLPGLSASGTGSVSVSLTICRAEDGWVDVTLAGAAQAAGSGSVGAAGLDVGGQASLGGRSALTWRLNLETKAGIAAYEGFLAGQVPTEGPGVQAPSHSVASSDGSHATVGLPGMTTQVGGERIDETLYRPDGTIRESDSGMSQERVSWARIMGDTLRDVDADIGATAVTERDRAGDELDSQVLIMARTSSNDATSNYEALGRAYGGSDSHRPGLGASTPGTWQLFSEFGPNSLQELKRAATDDKWDDPILERSLSSEQRRFIEDMRAAPDRAAERQAVQDFGDGGADAVRWLRGMLSDKRTESYLSLEGSGTWIGPGGWDEAERAFRDEMEKPEERRGDGLRELADQHRVRLHELGDHGRFLEVPDAIRAEEIARTKSFIRKVDTAIVASGGDLISESENNGLLLEIRKRQESVDRAYERVRGLMDEHGVGMDGAQKPWQTLGKVDYILFSLDGPAAAEYQAATDCLKSGEADRRDAGEHLAAAKEAESDIASSANTEANTHYQNALAALDRALKSFEDADTWIHWIEETYPSHSQRTE